MVHFISTVQWLCRSLVVTTTLLVLLVASACGTFPHHDEAADEYFMKASRIRGAMRDEPAQQLYPNGLMLQQQNQRHLNNALGQIDGPKPLFRIVHIGDSFSSGVGARDDEGDRAYYDRPKECLRSYYNWGRRFSTWFQDRHQDKYSAVLYDNRACMGGVISNYFAGNVEDYTAWEDSGRQTNYTSKYQGQELGGFRTYCLYDSLRKDASPEEGFSLVKDRCDSNIETGEDVWIRYTGYVVGPIYTTGPGNTIPIPEPYGHCYECRRIMRPQIEGVTPDTDLVLMTGGGNDVGFGEVVMKCFGVFIPGLLKSKGVHTTSASGCYNLLNNAKNLLDEVQANLTDILVDVFRKSENRTKVLFVGYPKLASHGNFELVDYTLTYHHLFGLLSMFEERTDAIDNTHQNWDMVCPHGGGQVYQKSVDTRERCDVVFSFNASQVVRLLGDELEKKQMQAVIDANQRANITFAKYVSLHERFKGHEPNPSHTETNPDGYMYEFTTILDWEPTILDWGSCLPKIPQYKEMYHPNHLGHDAIVEELKRHHEFVLKENSTDHWAGTRTSMDLAFVVDFSGSMTDDIADVKANIRNVLDTLKENAESYRVGIITYAGYEENFAGAISQVLDFSYDDDAIASAVDGIAADINRGWEPTFSAILKAFSMDWRKGVKKVLICFTDEPIESPENVTGTTMDDVVNAALELDPVAIYAVDSSGDLVNTDVAERLAVATGGEVLSVLNADQVAATIEAVIGTASLVPFAWIGIRYTTSLGKPILFDGSQSFAMNGTLIQYDWDFDGDGFYDANTTVPTFLHEYLEEYNGLVTLRVTDDAGRWALASAPVRVSADTDGDGVMDALDNCPTLCNPFQEDLDENGIGDACDEDYVSAPIVTARATPDTVKVGETFQLEGAMDDAGLSLSWMSWVAGDDCQVASEQAMTTTITCDDPGEHGIQFQALFNDTEIATALVFVSIIDDVNKNGNQNKNRNDSIRNQDNNNNKNGNQSKNRNYTLRRRKRSASTTRKHNKSVKQGNIRKREKASYGKKGKKQNGKKSGKKRG